MIPKGTVTLATDRLILRRFTVDDAEAMFRNWASDPEVTRYLTWQPHASVEASRQVLDRWIRNYESLDSNSDAYQWAIVPKNLGEPIGSISVVSVYREMETVTIGYCIGKAWWRQGYTSEALREVVRFFFEEVGVNRVQAFFATENPNSGKVMAKAGLLYEGVSRNAERNNQGVHDVARYALCSDDYFGKAKPPPGYIMNLRRYVGCMPLIMNGAGVIIENERGEVLLGRRRDNDCWTHAGGSTELGESCEDTARRELLEEMGLTANSLELLGVFSGKEAHYIYPNGDEVYNVAVIYVCRDFSGVPTAQASEVAELRWFATDELPTNISPPDKAVYRQYLQKRRDANGLPTAQ